MSKDNIAALTTDAKDYRSIFNFFGCMYRNIPSDVINENHAFFEYIASLPPVQVEYVFCCQCSVW